MKTYMVVSPEYMTYGSYGDGSLGLDPPEYGCDVVEVQALTKREAKILGLREFRRTSARWLDYCDGNPFTGIKVEYYDEFQDKDD